MAMASSYKVHRRRHHIPRRLKVLAVIILCLLVAATIAARYQYKQNLKPLSSSTTIHYVTIDPGLSVGDIGKQLEDQGIIRSKTAFELYVSSHNYRNELQAGTYSLKSSQSTPQIVTAIVNGKVATNLVTIIPGQRIDQIREDFIRSGFKKAAVDAALKPGQYRNDFPALADNPSSADLEGFLYPDSYQKTANTDPRQIVEEALAQMQKHLTVDIRKAFAKEGLTTYQGVTLASIVEQEVSDTNPSDRSRVAQVFLKRLRKNMTLGSDATARYGAIKNGHPPSLDYDSGYNTLIHKGLPPGPINTVSDSSLQAVAHPADTDWLYFVSGDDGTTHFSKTLKEHEALTKQYCHDQCGNTQL